MAAAPKSETLGILGERLRERRRELQLSQEALAARADLHWTYIGQVERGQHDFGIQSLLKLARALQIEPGRLLDGLALPD
ncbi:MAG TPA: helix-turn-helix transcriptional regulator [Mycobacteriales bacterium]|nr:helix-turn-helix transcriptional regulator [Mycobacteriales bacterium]